MRTKTDEVIQERGTHDNRLCGIGLFDFLAVSNQTPFDLI